MAKSATEPRADHTAFVLGINHISDSTGRVKPIVDPELPPSAYSDWTPPREKLLDHLVASK